MINLDRRRCGDKSLVGHDGLAKTRLKLSPNRRHCLCPRRTLAPAAARRVTSLASNRKQKTGNRNKKYASKTERESGEQRSENCSHWPSIRRALTPAEWLHRPATADRQCRTRYEDCDPEFQVKEDMQSESEFGHINISLQDAIIQHSICRQAQLIMSGMQWL